MDFLDLTPAQRAYLVLDLIKTYPEAHEQATWVQRKTACGTAACVAGWTSLLAGDQPLFLDHYDGHTGWVGVGGEHVLVDYRAGDLLGLNKIERYYLFAGWNSIEDIEGLIGEIYGPRPESGDWEVLILPEGVKPAGGGLA